jgi:eukaryotic-like serine/threonine-protein kinase
LQQVAARYPNNLQMHSRLALIADLEHDDAARQLELDWLTQHNPGIGFAFQAAQASLAGRLRDARTFWLKSADTDVRTGLAESGALTLLTLADAEAVYGFADNARRDVAAALKLASERDEALAASRILAMAGFWKEAKPLLDQCLKEYPPTHTLAKAVFIPAIRAALDLIGGNAESAVDELKQAAAYDGVGVEVMYLRASAYLSANRPADAAAEFQKLLDRAHNNLSFYEPIAKLGRARALSQMRDTGGSRAAYEDFFAAWKNADPDVPVLVAARGEYALLK